MKRAVFKDRIVLATNAMFTNTKTGKLCYVTNTFSNSYKNEVGYYIENTPAFYISGVDNFLNEHQFSHFPTKKELKEFKEFFKAMYDYD